MQTFQQIPTLPFLGRYPQTDDNATRTSSLSESVVQQGQVVHFRLELLHYLVAAAAAVVAETDES